VVAEQVRMGILSAQEAAQARTRHLLSRSLGNELFANVEISDHQFTPMTCWSFAPTAFTACLGQPDRRSNFLESSP